MKNRRLRLPFTIHFDAVPQPVWWGIVAAIIALFLIIWSFSYEKIL